MGYTTDFDGEFQLDKPLTPKRNAYLTQFSKTRRMVRNEFKTVSRPDPIRLAVGLPVGEQGAYFVGEGGWAGQDHGDDIVDYNEPPAGQPSLWCQWIPNEDGTAIVWDGGEKFYDYITWIEYLIANFLSPWGYTLNGTVEWVGEDPDDFGQIVVENNDVRVKLGKKVFYEKTVFYDQ